MRNAYRRFHITHGEGDRGRSRVFIGAQVHDIGDRGQVVDAVHAEHEGVRSCPSVTVLDRHRDGGGAELVGSRGQGDGAASASAANDDVGIGHYRLIARGGRDREARLPPFPHHPR